MKFKLGDRVRTKKREKDYISTKYFEEVDQVIIYGTIVKINYDSQVGIIIEVLPDGKFKNRYKNESLSFKEEYIEIDMQYYREEKLKNLGL